MATADAPRRSRSRSQSRYPEGEGPRSSCESCYQKSVWAGYFCTTHPLAIGSVASITDAEGR